MNKMRRSNLQTEMQVNGNTDFTYLQDQNCLLKEQISQLAKELDEHKAIIRDLTKERDEARHDLIGEKAFSRKIMDCVNDIQHSAQINLTNLVSSSNCVTDILKMTHTLNTFNTKERRSGHVPNLNVSLIKSSDAPKSNLSTNSNILNEITTKNTLRFTTLNPLNFLLNLDPNDAGDELPVANNLQFSEHHRNDQNVAPREGGQQENEFEQNNSVNTIAKEDRLNPSRGSLPNDLHISTNWPNNCDTEQKGSSNSSKLPKSRIFQRCKSSRAETSIQRRSNSLSEEDQIELTDDSEIITPNVSLLSSTVISSSPVKTTKFRPTKSFVNKRKFSPRIESGDPEVQASTIPNNLRLDSSNPVISKLEALGSYNLISVNKDSSINTKTSAKTNKNKFVEKSAVMKARRRKSKKHPTEIQKLLSNLSPSLLNSIALHSYRRRSELLPRIGKERKYKKLKREICTSKILKTRTRSPKTQT